MRDLLALALVVLALLACKRAGVQNSTTTTPAAVSTVDAGPSDASASDAVAPVTVECEGDAGTCYEQARAVCPNGFDELERSEVPVQPKRAGAPAAEILKPKITRPGGEPPAPMRTRLTVRCHEPPPAPPVVSVEADAAATDTAPLTDAAVADAAPAK